MTAVAALVGDIFDLKGAARLAARVTSSSPLERAYLLDEVEDSFSEIVEFSESLIMEGTGFSPSSRAISRVLSRAEWAAANIDSMVTLMTPLLGKLETRVAESPTSSLMRLAYRPALGAQMGAVLGLISQRVLGQYDVVMDRSDEVWFVGTNVVIMERRLGFAPRDFRLWIALHELTHRAQFEGNPWIRKHFLDSVGRFLESLNVDPKSFLERAFRSLASEDRRDLPPGMRLLDSEQRKQLDDLQAFMSVIEGHANFVMDRIGAEAIPTAERMRATLRGASPAGPLAKIIAKLLGLDMKRRQYEEGQAFFDAIFEEAGRDGVKRVFDSSGALPTLEEVRNPRLWLGRVG